MRLITLSATATTPTRLPDALRLDAATLAARLNASAKPATYPATAPSKTRTTVKPRSLNRSQAMMLATAYVLDQIDAGRMGEAELLAMVEA
ncbi:hypothetical protein N9878_02250 [bacterium]|nr:hypothetical protein [bacterium]